MHPVKLAIRRRRDQQSDADARPRTAIFRRTMRQPSAQSASANNTPPSATSENAIAAFTSFGAPLPSLA